MTATSMDLQENPQTAYDPDMSALRQAQGEVEDQGAWEDALQAVYLADEMILIAMETSVTSE